MFLSLKWHRIITSKWTPTKSCLFEILSLRYDLWFRFEMTVRNCPCFRNDIWLSLRNDGAKFSSARLFWSARILKICGRKIHTRSIRTNPRMWKEETAWKRMPVFWPSTKRESRKRNCAKDVTKDGHQRLCIAATAWIVSSAMWVKRWWMRQRELRKTVWVPSRKSAPKNKCKCTRKES